MSQAAQEHRSTLKRLQRLLERDLGAFWGAQDHADAKKTAAATADFMPSLTTTYGDLAAVLAADYYEKIRAERVPSARLYTPRLADPPPIEQAVSLARWGVGPLFSADPNPDAALTLLSGGAQRLTANTGRRTVALNSVVDKVATGRFSRDATSSGCDWCQSLAAKGPVFADADIQFHDHCSCVAVPDFG